MASWAFQGIEASNLVQVKFTHDYQVKRSSRGVRIRVEIVYALQGDFIATASTMDGGACQTGVEGREQSRSDSAHNINTYLQHYTKTAEFVITKHKDI